MAEGTFLFRQRINRPLIVPFFRAASRIGSQLSAAVYDKALRIVDPSGAVAKTAKEKQKDGSDNADVKKDKTTPAEDTQEDESGASVGKIVNIMGIDA